MTLKNQVKNVYGVGLNNVGSYQTSGKPFVTASTVTDGTEKQIEFPEVSNNITVKLDSASGGANPTAVKMVGKQFYYENTDTTNVASNGDSRSMSIWVSCSSDLPVHTLVISTTQDSFDNFSIRSSGNFWTARAKSNNGNSHSFIHIHEGWQHLTLTTAPNDFSVFYHNGIRIDKKATTNTVGERLGAGLRIGAHHTNLTTDATFIWKDAILWDGVLSETQVKNLYNAGLDYSDSAYTAVGLPNKLIWAKVDESAGADSSTIINHGDSENYGNLSLIGSGGSNSSTLVSPDEQLPLETIFASGYKTNGEFIVASSPAIQWPADFTIVQWIKTQYIGGTRALIVPRHFRVNYKGSNQRVTLIAYEIDSITNGIKLPVSDGFNHNLGKEFAHVVMTYDHDLEAKCYVNGQLEATLDFSTKTMPPDGAVSQGFSYGIHNLDMDISLLDAGIFHKTFNQDEVNEAYNNGSILDLRTHSASGVLKHYWRFGNNPSDTFNNNGTGVVTALINDNAGSDLSPVNLVANAADGDDEIQEFSVFSAVPYSGGGGGGGGELRVHYRSKDHENVTLGKHYWTLDSQNESITMNVKSKELYLSANGGDCDYSVEAELTNIPSSRMFQHTGSGVDE